jgi:tetratricopeptide (TPR) repeat protein
MAESQPLRIFVAMPGTDMGPNASYRKPESVKANLLQPVVEKLQSRLKRPVELIIEKEKRVAGVIHESMFSEARDADVYIADLTGANPNVYLELGVRWALRDHTTVLIAQSTEDLRFNVAASRAILYCPDHIIQATDDIVEAIEKGLNNQKPDGPVRLNSEYVSVPKSDLDKLKAEIERLQKARGEDLLRAAVAAEQLTDRVAILKQAVDANPASDTAFLELGKAYRTLRQYDNAIAAFKHALRFVPNKSEVHRELGLTYSKVNEFNSAVESLREAVRLDPDDVEAWNNLGGALRRIGMSDTLDIHDKQKLFESRDSYKKAHDLNNFDLYSGLNVARLDLLLSKWEPHRAKDAMTGFANQLYLCRHMVHQTPDDYWRRFDLADTLLFSGDYDAAHSAYDDAVRLVPNQKLKDTVASVQEPLKQYLKAGILDGPLLEEVKKVIAKLDTAASKTS